MCTITEAQFSIEHIIINEVLSQYCLSLEGGGMASPAGGVSFNNSTARVTGIYLFTVEALLLSPLELEYIDFGERYNQVRLVSVICKFHTYFLLNKNLAKIQVYLT